MITECPVQKFVDEAKFAKRYIILADYIIENECAPHKKVAFSNHTPLHVIPMERYKLLEFCINHAIECCDKATELLNEEIVFYEEAEKDCGVLSVECCKCEKSDGCDWDALVLQYVFDKLKVDRRKCPELKEKFAKIRGVTSETLKLLDECENDWDRLQANLREC